MYCTVQFCTMLCQIQYYTAQCYMEQYYTAQYYNIQQSPLISHCSWIRADFFSSLVLYRTCLLSYGASDASFMHLLYMHFSRHRLIRVLLRRTAYMLPLYVLRKCPAVWARSCIDMSTMPGNAAPMAQPRHIFEKQHLQSFHEMYLVC